MALVYLFVQLEEIPVKDRNMPTLVLVIFCSTLLFLGCGGREVVEVEATPSQKMEVAETPKKSTQDVDLKTVQELAGKSVVSPSEAVRVSNRMLQEDLAPVLDEQTLNNLEKILLAALPQSSKDTQPVIQRNLGIVNYYSKKYNKARQALQSSNETNPRDARTHYYLACLFNHQARIFAAKGEPTKAQRVQKRAQIEIDTARKLEPGNPLYRKNLSSLGE
jgi:tetratricopeptide (TPR) repeat protein